MAHTNPLSLPYMYDVTESNAHGEDKYVGWMPLVSISLLYKLRIEAENRIVRECREDGNTCTLYMGDLASSGRCMFRLKDRVVLVRSGSMPTDGVDA